MSSQESILVIRHGALGDMILATAAMKAIRVHHPNAHITLLTTKPYAELMAQSPYFDEIWIDSKPRWYQRDALRRLATMLNSKPWVWIYDLQTSTRSTLYIWLLARPWPNISNVSRWTSHSFTDADRGRLHAYEHDKRQLALAGINALGLPDISWMQTPLNTIPPAPYALLAPGGAAHRPEKRWPAEQYASLAQELAQRGITPVLIGAAAEGNTLNSIATRVPQSVNLGGKTSIPQLATLARNAICAIGNDTGPMHVIAATGCPSTILFSRNSDPARSAPVGGHVTILKEPHLANMSVDRVLCSIHSIIAPYSQK